jgi:hypothetical protein
MKLHPNVGLIIAAFALAVILAGTANAQLTVVRDAHFTLPFQARCADTVLPAKNYTLSVVRLSGGGYAKYAVTFAGAGTNKTILALRAQGPQVGERSMLIVESRGEIRSIRALHLPNADLVLAFPESKAERQPVAKAPEAMQSVPILVTAN